MTFPVTFEARSATWTFAGVAAEAAAGRRTVRPWLHDLPELRRAETEIREAVLRLVGVDDALFVPDPLPRDWSGVLLGQTAAHRYARGLADQAQLVATPRYRAQGSDGPFNRSALLVRAGDPAQGLDGVRGRRGAISADDLNSAMALGAAAAPASEHGRFFGSVTRFPTWPLALDALLEGDIDAAVIDGVTLTLLARYRPKTAARARVLLWTAATPGAPLVTGRSTPAELVDALRAALRTVERDPALAAARRALLLEGFNVLRPPHYRAALHLEQIAESLGYAELR